MNRFVDFVGTEHGPAEALQSDDVTFESRHACFLDRSLSSQLFGRWNPTKVEVPENGQNEHHPG